MIAAREGGREGWGVKVKSEGGARRTLHCAPGAADVLSLPILCGRVCETCRRVFGGGAVGVWGACTEEIWGRCWD